MRQSSLSTTALVIATFLTLCGTSTAIINSRNHISASPALVSYWGSDTSDTTWGNSTSSIDFGSYKTTWSSTSKNSVWGSKKSTKTFGKYTTQWGDDSESEWGVLTNNKSKYSNGAYTTTWQVGNSVPWSPSVASSSAVYVVPRLDTKGALWGGQVGVTWESNPNSSTTSTTSVATSTHFKRDLEVGSDGPDVLALQKFLNTHNFKIAESGLGSLGEESDYFGEKTKAALAAFQLSNGISPAEGYCGTTTRSVLKTMGWVEK